MVEGIGILEGAVDGGRGGAFAVLGGFWAIMTERLQCALWRRGEVNWTQLQRIARRSHCDDSYHRILMGRDVQVRGVTISALRSSRSLLLV